MEINNPKFLSSLLSNTKVNETLSPALKNKEGVKVSQRLSSDVFEKGTSGKETFEKYGITCMEDVLKVFGYKFEDDAAFEIKGKPWYEQIPKK